MTIKTEMKFDSAKPQPKIKSKARILDVHLSASNADFGIEVRRFFDIARSSGQELDLYFGGHTRLNPGSRRL
jgi:hypothetical protein